MAYSVGIYVVEWVGLLAYQWPIAIKQFLYYIDFTISDGGWLYNVYQSMWMVPKTQGHGYWVGSYFRQAGDNLPAVYRNNKRHGC